MRGLKTTLGRLAAAPVALALTTASAMASTGGGGNLPWDGPLQIIAQDLSGTVAHIFIIIAIVTTGLFWAFGEHGSSMRKVAGICAGGSLALGAASFVGDLGLGSGAVISGYELDTQTIVVFALWAPALLLALSVGVAQTIRDLREPAARIPSDAELRAEIWRNIRGDATRTSGA